MATIIQPIPFTPDAYAKMEHEVQRLSTERVEVMARLKTAREMGDLSENGAYQYAKFELGNITRQLRELNHLLAHGKVTTKTVGSTVVEFGSTVTVLKDGEEITYMMVSMHESDLKTNKLSIEGPLGKALLSKKVGDEVEVETPRGVTKYTITKIA